MQMLGNLGGFAFVIGIAAFILEFFDRQLVILSWMYNWGPTPALMIKIGLIVLGGALWLFARRGGNRAED